MTTLLSPATGKYLLEPAPEHLHQDATGWLSDFEFYKTEIAFLSRLLDKAFLRVTHAQKLSDLHLLETKVNLFREVFLKQLHDELVLHEQHLAELDLELFSQNKEAIHEEHQAKFVRVKSFMHDVKDLKKEIFDLVEKQLKTAKKVTKDFEEGNMAL